MLCRTLIPDFQTSAMSNEGSPHILARQAFAHFPGFVEYRNRTIGFDFPNEMQSPSSDGQRIRQVGNLRERQPVPGFGALRLSGGQAGQQRGRIVHHIPLHESRTGSTHMPERGKPLPLPEGMAPQAVQLFDLAIAFGFGDGQEDKFS